MSQPHFGKVSPVAVNNSAGPWSADEIPRLSPRSHLNRRTSLCRPLDNSSPDYKRHFLEEETRRKQAEEREKQEGRRKQAGSRLKLKRSQPTDHFHRIHVIAITYFHAL